MNFIIALITSFQRIKIRKNENFRKPGIGFFKIAKKFRFVTKKSFMIGDTLSDTIRKKF